MVPDRAEIVPVFNGEQWEETNLQLIYSRISSLKSKELCEKLWKMGMKLNDILHSITGLKDWGIRLAADMVLILCL